jgi:hypothetical protein
LAGLRQREEPRRNIEAAQAGPGKDMPSTERDPQEASPGLQARG